MPLSTLPQAVSLGTLITYYQSTLRSSWTGAFGNAKAPANSRPPRLHGMYVIQAADPGTNEARYVHEGVHESPRKLVPARFEMYGPEGIQYAVDSTDKVLIGPEDHRVYYLLSRATADQNKGAEAQHLNDHRIAFGRTLGLLEQLLKGIQRQGVPALPVPEDIIVVKMLESEMRAQKVSPKVFSYAQMKLDLAQWSQKYADLVARSQKRDVQGWHLWTLRHVSAREFNRTWRRKRTYYLDGSTASPGIPAYIEVVPSESFNLAPTFDQIPD